MQQKKRSALWEHAQRRQRAKAPVSKASSGLKERLEQIRMQANLPDDEGVALPWIEAAAVLASFNPSTILCADGKQASDYEAFEGLIEASIPAPAAGGARTLDLNYRRKILKRMGSRATMQAALAHNLPGPDVPVQQGFNLLLNGPKSVDKIRQSRDTALLTGIAEALLWIEGTLPDVPDRNDILRELASARMTQPLQELVGTHFAGRETVLEQMKAYFNEPLSVENVFYLHGAGGAGKSTVLAKFAMDLRAEGAIELIVYLNFDRPTLDIREPLTILREMVIQMAAQTQHPQMEHLEQEIDAYLRRYASGRNALEAISDGGGDWWEMISGVASAIRAIDGDGPFLVLIDTFERAQKYGESVVREFWRMLTALGKQAPRLRIVAAGRVDSFELFQNERALGGLERQAVAKILEEVCGEPLDADLVDDVHDATGGRPLGVRLAGILFKSIGITKLNDPQTRADALLEVQSEQAEAVLYNRILGQISNQRVKLLARKGLLLRLVTPGLIREVLAPVAGLSLSVAEAELIFDDYGKEVDLVTPGFAEWGEPMLTHRSDVRCLMLDDLRAAAPNGFSEVDEKAISYFQSKKGAMARAEEIYHRLWSAEEITSIEKRWMDECGTYLQGAVEEIPRAHRPWLANRVGIDLPPDAEAEADQAEWEAFATRTAQTRLNRGDVEGVLEILDRRSGRLPGSPLFAIEADAYSRVGNVSKARKVVDHGLESAAKAGARGQAAQLWLVRSLISERARQFAAAGRDAARAYAIAEDLSVSDIALRSVATLLRLHRKSRHIVGPEPVELVAKANTILDRIGDRTLFDQPGLMRSLAGELGPTRPDLLALAVQSTGHDTISTPKPQLREAEAQAATALGEPRFGKVADVVDQINSKSNQTLRDVMTQLVSVAAERGLLTEVSVPIAHVIAAEVDQLIGAFPAPSLLRTRGEYSWWQALGTYFLAH